MAQTTLDLITEVYLDMGVIADEQSPTPSQVVGGLSKLTDLIESLNLDNLAVYGQTQYIIPLVAGKKTYTIGTGGDLNIARPTDITVAFVRNTFQSVTQQYDQPLEILSNAQYASLPFKSWTGGYPFVGVWFDMTNPLITAYVNPVPTNGQYSLVFWAANELSIPALNTVLTLAPGYRRYLKAQLFIELSSSFQVQIPEAIALIARSAKSLIDKKNLEVNELNTGMHSGYDIYSNRIR